MNNEIKKAIEKAKKPIKENKIKKWWNKNSIYVFRAILLPIYVSGLIITKMRKSLDNRRIWNEEKAKTILDYYIPRRSDYNVNDSSFYFFDNGCGWGIKSARKYLNRKDYRFWKKFGFYGGDIRRYLINIYELEGYAKKVLNTQDGWTEIEFIKK